MMTSILIAVALDHEPILDRKIAHARHNLAPGGKITLITVLEQVSGFTAEFVTVKSENHLTDRIMSHLKSLAGNAPDIDCRVASGKAGVQIAAVATEIGADLIIVGAHNPLGALDYFLGSTAARVVRRAPCSVCVLR
ncbi:universal stress protein [Meridianimarinicoccus aquatilis]|uniref:Universal stress protein n=1 Tax=Meridianimarinicoccus aquatilis TaxID=2552766 RepID=A0A4R6B3I9_9RHOB|nr:universal stress protein [Fluviibacterium aquatile]QIE43421.1 universal stress protein [Rhodobacteraceae bacterium SC52]TDL90804.1 universal stress protein [Fluviibacterium aquatile]